MFSLQLEETHIVKWEEAEQDRADNAAEWDSTEAVSRIVRVGAFAVVAGDK